MMYRVEPGSPWMSDEAAVKRGGGLIDMLPCPTRLGLFRMGRTHHENVAQTIRSTTTRFLLTDS